MLYDVVLEIKDCYLFLLELLHIKINIFVLARKLTILLDGMNSFIEEILLIFFLLQKIEVSSLYIM